jgi:hypothetical protein
MLQIEEWNRRNPRLRISPKNRRARIDGEDSGAPEEQERAYAGDDLLRELNRWRGMIAPADTVGRAACVSSRRNGTNTSERTACWISQT